MSLGHLLRPCLHRAALVAVKGAVHQGGTRTFRAVSRPQRMSALYAPIARFVSTSKAICMNGMATKATRAFVNRANSQPGWTKTTRLSHFAILGMLPRALPATSMVFRLMFTVQCEPSTKQPVVVELQRQKAQSSRAHTKDEKPFKMTWAMLWELIKPDLLLLLWAVASAVGVAVVNVQIPGTIGTLVNTITSGGGAEAMRKVAWKLIGHYLLHALFTWQYITVLGLAGENIALRLRSGLFSSIVRQDMAFFDSNKTGDLVDRLTNDVEEFKSSMKQVVSIGLRNMTQALGSAIAMYRVSPQLTLGLAIVVPTIILIGTTLGSFLRKFSRRGQAARSACTSSAHEVIGSIKTVRAFGMEEREEAAYEVLARKCRNIYAQLAAGIGIFQAGSTMFLNGVVLGVIYYGGILLSRDQLSPGDLMQFLVSSQTIQRALSNTSVLFGQVVRGTAAGTRVFEFIKHPSSIPIVGGERRDIINGAIHFSRVSFSYPTRPEQQILNEFDLAIPANKMVALCGPSGAGKSTIAALVERLYDVNGGGVYLDGVNIKDLCPQWLRQDVIGYINQEPTLFATTVLENIRYGKPSATDDEVKAAAKLANAHEFIEGFPDGYDTLLGERGATVSGGQRQRIAIARALLKNPPVLILDEATSALDAKSERLVQEALDRLTTGRTVLVIAHRLSTIQHADNIVLVEGGRVVESGTHDQLIAKGGAYSKLVKNQVSGEGGFIS
eukprot:m.199009 g.199009  ORF g.199009 m.199009 type:complete len:726 (-) comp14929_c1_seq2:230-2407(-)